MQEKNRVDWECPGCGLIEPTKVQIYQTGGLFNTHSFRVGPWCATCGKRLSIVVRNNNDPTNVVAGTKTAVLMLSGSCASGKTTLSYLIANKLNAVQIDGDWILHLRREELGKKIDFKEIDLDICQMTEAFVRFGKKVIIAQIILPDTVETYANYFKKKGISYRLIVLMPSEATILKRNETRKCWPKQTPEYWVRTFWAELDNGSERFREAFYDNSDETSELTASRIIAKCL